jgi:uncharacterized protein RhaS with RHS repeats
LAGGINTYAYVGANPISNSDPSGLEQCDIDAAVKTAQNRRPDMNFGRGAPKIDITSGGKWGESQNATYALANGKADYYIHMNVLFLQPLNDFQSQFKVLENYFHEGAHFTNVLADHTTIYPEARQNALDSWNDFKAARDKLCGCKGK